MFRVESGKWRRLIRVLYKIIPGIFALALSQFTFRELIRISHLFTVLIISANLQINRSAQDAASRVTLQKFYKSVVTERNFNLFINLLGFRFV
jgi:hypothetical protein